jgi:dTDP-4-dehydrorhamnose reductase
LVYGSRGWIGGQLAELIQRAGDKLVEGSRVKNFEETLEEVKSVKPDRIICCLGRTSGPGYTTIDYLEGRLKENLDDNLGAPLILAEISKELNISMLYFGTGCIFEYDKEHTTTNFNGFKEEDTPNFTGSSYSTVKGRTDSLMR